ncbi:MAG: 50S ribosomal protein L3 [Deltaproteobacteria bacterium]|nr:50S ribosomal protein L3 [Deltaproteobacteria bacterium]
MVGLIGKKLGMTQIFAADGTCVPVTVIQAGHCAVVQKKTPERDGYAAVQIGFGEKKPQRATKAERGHCARSGKGPFAILREFRGEGLSNYEVGQEVSAGALFQPGDLVDVTGRTKGRGYAGVVKRHGMKGFPATHGTHEYFRHGGSIGNRSFPGRVFKGKRMAGHYGDKRVTVQRLRVVDVRPEGHLLLVRGAIPGARGGIVLVRRTVKG